VLLPVAPANATSCDSVSLFTTNRSPLRVAFNGRSVLNQATRTAVISQSRDYQIAGEQFPAIKR
jgi:hypothetical protein